MKDQKFVKDTVGRTFEDDVSTSFKHSLVLFYYQWCLDTGKMRPVLDIVAEGHSNNRKLDFYMFDLTMNEHVDVEHYTNPKDYPILFHYDPRDKSKPVKYEGEFEEAPLRKWIRERLGFDYIIPTELTKRRKREIYISYGFK